MGAKWESRFRKDVESFLIRCAHERSTMPSYVPMHVAILYNGNKIVSGASNAYERHAEINCMDDMSPSRIKHNKPLKLFVAKVSGGHCMSRPCRECCREIRRRIPRARVFYTDYDGALCEDCDLDNSHENLAQRNRQKRREEEEKLSRR